MHDLFCYGTLQLPSVIRKVIGRMPGFMPAELRHFACYRVNGACYPAVVPKKGFSTGGVVYFDLNVPELLRLDRFEGSEYRRLNQVVVLENGVELPVFVYVWRLDWVSRLSKKHWDLQYFSHSYEYSGFSANRLNYPR